MSHFAYVERLVNLIDPSTNTLLNKTREEAMQAIASGDPEAVHAIEGHFALIHKDKQIVRMARSIGRPMRYFLAKRQEGPCLIVAERIDQIYKQLQADGLEDQFHPSYTRMVPAHHIVEIELIGCPDPNPVYTRFLTPERNKWSSDLDEIGEGYIQALAHACDQWLDHIPPTAPIGVLFSGGIDSGALFLTLHHVLCARGDSPARLKAFTLSVQGGQDAHQAHQFLQALGLSLFLEVVEVAAEDLDYREAIAVTEDYKPLDVQAATMTLALCRAIRERYPDWVYLVDGDGGDENLKDYPIEENPELTIRSVLNNPLLYQEGWGVDRIKHSLVYSGGQSRGHVRSFAPVHTLGFRGFSPFSLPHVIEFAEGIPFIELTGWDHDRLYELKGEITRRGVQAVTGMEMPIHPKNRFQHGAVDNALFDQLFPASEREYREAFKDLYE